MNRLLAIDLDGTLLADDGTISARNAQTIRKAQEAGNIVSICSGRSLHDTREILAEAKLECPMITGNGAITFHNEEQLQTLSMETALLEELLPKLEAEHYYYELYTNDGVYLFERGKEMLEREIEKKAGSDKTFSTEWAIHEMNIQFEQKGTRHITDYREYDLANLGVYKVFVFSFHPEKLAALEEQLASRDDLSLTTSGKTKLEIAHKDTSKGNALAAFAEVLGVPMKNTVAIGDNLNDLSMFAVAGMGIAMGNAEEEVKEASTHITKRSNEDGVAHAIEAYILA